MHKIEFFVNVIFLDKHFTYFENKPKGKAVVSFVQKSKQNFNSYIHEKSYLILTKTQSYIRVAFSCNVTSRTTRRAFIGRSKICILPTYSFSSSLRNSKGSLAIRKIHKEKMKICNIAIGKGLRL